LKRQTAISYITDFASTIHQETDTFIMRRQIPRKAKNR
jgi:hypothetical protein